MTAKSCIKNNITFLLTIVLCLHMFGCGYKEPVLVDSRWEFLIFQIQGEYEKESFEDLDDYDQPRLYFYWRPKAVEKGISLWSLNVDGTRLVEVATQQELFGDELSVTAFPPHVSESGRYIAYTVEPKGRSWHRQTMVFDVKTRRRLAVGVIGKTIPIPKWGPDNTLIFYADEINQQDVELGVYTVKVEDGEVKQLTQLGDRTKNYGELNYVKALDQYVAWSFRDNKIMYLDPKSLEVVNEHQGIFPRKFNPNVSHDLVSFSTEGDCIAVRGKNSRLILSLTAPEQPVFERGELQSTSSNFAFQCQPYIGFSTAASSLEKTLLSSSENRILWQLEEDSNPIHELAMKVFPADEQ